MSEFLKMDIFFVITSVVVIMLGILVGVLLWRIERILRHVEHISEQAAMESELIRQDMSDMRREIRSGKSRLASLVGFIGKFAKRAKKPKS